MDFNIKTLDAKNTPASIKTGCIVVGIYESRALSDAAKALDGKGDITAAVESGDMSGKTGSKLLLRKVEGIAAERVLLVGLGKEELAEKDFKSAIKAAADALAVRGAADAVIALPFGEVKGRDASWAVHAAVVAMREQAYRFDRIGRAHV